MDSIYKALVLDHFHNPRNKGDLDGMDRVSRGSNPRCGDEIEVGIRTADGVLNRVGFRGRGCSICLASASIMSECASGLMIAEAQRLVRRMRDWFDDEQSPAPSNTSLAALGALREHPARKKCVLLAWIALDEILSGL